MMKIGILGGTFNPIHNGHIEMCEYCRKSIGLDKIIIIPTYTPPHKEFKELVSGEHRINMIELAAKSKPYLETSDIELKRQGKSYTYETLISLKEIYPDDELYFITGADMFLTLDKWKNPSLIFDNAKLAAVPRNSADKKQLWEYYRDVIKNMGASAVILDEPVMYVSSTYIRDNIKNYELIKDLIDKRVYNYIIDNMLYRE